MLPSYLKKGALETFSVGMVKTLLKSVLDGTFDDQKEWDMLNKILYNLIPSQDKPLFKSKFLKNTTSKSLNARSSQPATSR
jgi:hypothetical protein